MICGIGVDIVEIARIQRIDEKHPQRLAQKLLSPFEIEAWMHVVPQERAAFLAKRFAAKEAVVKALGSGLRFGMQWSDIAILHGRLGQPEIALAGMTRSYWHKHFPHTRWHLSLSDERTMVVAFVTLSRLDPQEYTNG